MRNINFACPDQLVEALDKGKKHMSRTAYMIHLLNTALELDAPLPKPVGRPRAKTALEKEQEERDQAHIEQIRNLARQAQKKKSSCEK